MIFLAFFTLLSWQFLLYRPENKLSLECWTERWTTKHSHHSNFKVSIRKMPFLRRWDACQNNLLCEKMVSSAPRSPIYHQPKREKSIKEKTSWNNKLSLYWNTNNSFKPPHTIINNKLKKKTKINKTRKNKLWFIVLAFQLFSILLKILRCVPFPSTSLTSSSS